MSCISRRKRAPSTKKTDSAEEQETSVATVISSTSSTPAIEVIIPPIDDGEGQLIIDETADDNEELRELKRELTKMKKEHDKLYRELNHVKNAIAAYRGDVKAMRDNSYDSQFIWRLTPASEVLPSRLSMLLSLMHSTMAFMLTPQHYTAQGMRPCMSRCVDNFLFIDMATGLDWEPK